MRSTHGLRQKALSGDEKQANTKGAKTTLAQNIAEEAQTLGRKRGGRKGGFGGGFDAGATPLALEEDPPPLALIPDPVGALQP
jgi:hypothetical protein